MLENCSFYSTWAEGSRSCVVRGPSVVVNFSHFRLLWNRWIEFNETWQEARSQRPLPSLCFSGWSEKQDGRPGLWLAETFSTSPLKPLNGIQRNLTGNKILTSSTKFFFQADRKNKMAALAPDWLRHFRLLLWNRWTACNETWQEERSQRPLSSLCFLGRSEKLDGRPGQSVKKVAYCTQVHDMWPFGPLFLKLCCYLHNNHQVYIGVSLRTFSPLIE